VLFVTNDRFSPNVENAVHAFCHAVPEHLAPDGRDPVGDRQPQLAGRDRLKKAPGELTAALGAVWAVDVSFLPYLGGERTPTTTSTIRAGFAGISHETDDTELTHAVLDGVAFALKDCLER
jgi:xylulokinase